MRGNQLQILDHAKKASRIESYCIDVFPFYEHIKYHVQLQGLDLRHVTLKLEGGFFAHN